MNSERKVILLAMLYPHSPFEFSEPWILNFGELRLGDALL
ncbi:hypothetical protein NBRC111893_1126 [Lentilactobacillus kosonis]|uniref:Uncharacterized protein n=1 Tax=Lentilactobacillus kosonis TaxID=2810561 RepID=A0A401FKS4_9LACO|nr:hypothetical protein NBRC111893_1126 [Lentilactobacillus kosonis]